MPSDQRRRRARKRGENGVTEPENAKKPPRTKVTINDVAKAAGVSMATVSLVMQSKGQLSQSTRDRVFEAAVTVGYIRREPQKTRRKRPASYWMVVDDIGNPYFHEIYRGICDNLDQRDTIVTMLSSDDILEKQSQILDNLMLLKASGLILVPASGTHVDHLASIIDARVPFVLAVRNIGAGQLDYIGGNPMLGMSIAANHLVSLGHQRIAFVGGYPSNYAYHERYAGLVSTMSQHALTISEQHVISGGSNKAFGRKAASTLLALPEPPTAIIGYNDLVAIGIMDAISEHGLAVGRDIAVVGYDDIPESSEQPVPLTTIATPARGLGKIVANTLRRIINDPEHAPINMTQPPTLVIRQSCGGAGKEEAN
jgi:DNA-binding LacI/PurR family transcriptional regulator